MFPHKRTDTLCLLGVRSDTDLSSKDWKCNLWLVEEDLISPALKTQEPLRKSLKLGIHLLWQQDQPIQLLTLYSAGYSSIWSIISQFTAFCYSRHCVPTLKKARAHISDFSQGPGRDYTALLLHTMTNLVFSWEELIIRESFSLETGNIETQRHERLLKCPYIYFPHCGT